jgi:hypothetical protein
MNMLANLSNEALMIRREQTQAELDLIEEELRARRRVRENEIQHKLKRGEPFRDDELVYAAKARCDCGAGLAYPRDMGMHGYWDCSDILTGRSMPGEKTHCGPLPFMFYEIKSEDQPSAEGATTRQQTLGSKT